MSHTDLRATIINDQITATATDPSTATTTVQTEEPTTTGLTENEENNSANGNLLIY